jgi:hypothetical protein
MPNNGNTPNSQQQQQHEWSPFIGPRSFRRDVEEQKLFFGRRYETERIISLIYSHKLVLVYAESGAGKTSIFNASIIPTLEQRNLEVLPVARVGIGTEVSTDTTPSTDRTSSTPLRYWIANGSGPKSEFNPYMYNAFQSLSRKKSTLRNISLLQFLSIYFPHKVDEKRGRQIPQVLVFDQLEELFNLYIDPDKWREQQEDFFKQITQVIEIEPLLRVVVIIREDYLAQLEPFAYQLPGKLRARFRLEPLKRDAASLAVTQPLKNTDVSFASGVAEELVDNLTKIHVEDVFHKPIITKGEYVEPVHLQVVCQRLWNKVASQNITQITYDQLEDVEAALKEFYEEAVHITAKVTKIREQVIRDWCENKLITTTGTRSIIHQESSLTGGLSNKAVSILEDKYLIRAESRFGATWIELTHDRLIDPIKNSNKEWRIEQERLRYEERKREKLVLKITIPSAVLVIVVVVFVYLWSPHTPASPLVYVGGAEPGLTISNQYKTDVIVAIAYNSPDCANNGIFKKAGWLNLGAGQSRQAINGNLGANSGYIAYWAVAKGGSKIWDGTTTDQHYSPAVTTVNFSHGFGPECWDKQEKYKVSFRVMQISPNISHETVNLTEHN